MGKLQRIAAWLAELCPREATPLWQRLQVAEDRNGGLREQAQQATATLEEALPRYSQLSEGLELVAGSLAWLQDHTRHPLALRGDPVWLQEQLWENSLRLVELEKLGVALETLHGQGVELEATLQSTAHPAVQERLQDLWSQWQLLGELEKEREASLQELLALARQFWPGLAKLAGALGNTQRRVLDLEDTAASDPKDIPAKLAAMQALRGKLDALQSELDSLGACGMELMSLCGDPEKPTVTKSLDDLYSSWHSLNRMWAEQQKHLEDQLPASVTDPATMQRLLAWQAEAEVPGEGDPELKRVALWWAVGKTDAVSWQVLQKDVLSHSMMVQAVQEAGWRLQLPSDGSGARTEVLQGSLRQLSHRWSQVLAKTEHRQLALEHKLSQVREVSLEVAGLVQWLDQVELQLFSSKPTWDPSEATKDKLAALLELCEEMESKWPTYQRVQEKLRPLLASCHPNGASMAERSLRALEQKWASLSSCLQEQKEQLLQSPNRAAGVQAALQKLLKWVKQTEEALAALPPPSYILDTVSKQRGQQQALAQEAEAQSKKLAGLAVGAACLTQDNGGPRSLVASAKERLAKVLQQVTERGEVLEEAHQQAKQFRESWQLLLKWMDGLESACPAPAGAPPVKPEDLKALLGQHKGFQRRLRAKRPIFEAALQQGGLLRGRALLPADGQELDAMQRELKERWGALWSWAAERQQKLEELLLSSGCFSDALQSLLDWLCWVEPQLAEETPVAGDRDLVGTLMEQHKAFQAELGQRAVSLRTLRCSAQELARGGSSVDTRWLQSQMEELEERWEHVGRLSVSQQTRLEGALRQAEEFHRLLCTFLSRLSGLEKSVVDGAPPEEEEALTEGRSQLEELQQRVQCQQLELDCISSLGEEILSACHPDAVGTVHSWVDLAKSRFQQLCSRVQQQEQRLQAQAASLAVDRKVLERLSDWITAAEEALSLRDQEPLPEDARQLEELHIQHMVFLQELGHKQAEVEKAAKNGRQERAAQVGATASSCQWSSGWHGTSRALPQPPLVPLEDLEPQSPLLAQLVHRWQCLWLAAQDRQRRLQRSQQRHPELEERVSFDFAAWRKRYLQWIGHRKSRVLDIFHSIDRGHDGRLTQQEFIGRVLASKFPTSLPEMKAVAKIFDVNRDGFIDYYEFIRALHPSRDVLQRAANVDHIQEEVKRQVAECNCVKCFQVEQIGATRYRLGECQQLRMVRILRSTLMVRVGGGWTALDEFLVKNDPCRVKGRTNLKINERYLSPGLLGRKGTGSQSAPASKMLSPSCSTPSLCLYSSASAPSSPVPRKAVLRRTHSGDRCLPSCHPAGAAFAAGAAGPGAEPPGHPRREAVPRDVPAP
ncbi:microtubule-actin cross-linking factor 1-like [Pseudonaja textilis]|uniref:microtubule-actin cross-linking factor 1-like n=1 Tax=Pseudonaja textilis TaxID=8673 RepID=UPI000EA96194|nr:microtubule-actin cross-linking factor 1-like [Pseudonaja textilis]